MIRGCFQREGAPCLAEGKRQFHQATPPPSLEGSPAFRSVAPPPTWGLGGQSRAPCLPSLHPSHCERSVRPSVGLATRTLSTSEAKAFARSKTTCTQCISCSLPSPRPRSLSGGPSFPGVTCRLPAPPRGMLCAPWIEGWSYGAAPEEDSEQHRKQNHPSTDRP